LARPVILRKQAIDIVKNSLLKIDGEPTSWSFDLKKLGLRNTIKALADVSPDECPFVVVFGGDSRWNQEAPVNIGKREEFFDAVILAIVKPDDKRYPDLSTLDLQELLIGDVMKTIEANAITISCGILLDFNVAVSWDPLLTASIIEFTLTYRLRGTLGL
jgi:hypothetical protein